MRKQAIARHRNTRKILMDLQGHEKRGGLVKLAEKLGKTPQQAGQFAGPNPSRAIGDNLAEEIEKAFELPNGALDEERFEYENGKYYSIEADVIDKKRLLNALKYCQKNPSFPLLDDNSLLDRLIEAYKNKRGPYRRVLCDFRE